jgi:hypothetical protein
MINDRARILEWHGEIEKEFDRICAKTPLGKYWILLTDAGYYWGYSFERYYDENQFPCENIEEGKKAALKNWQSRLNCYC